MLVIDASAAVELLLDTAVGRRVVDRVLDADGAIHAPELLAVEVASAAGRMEHRSMIDAAASVRVVDQIWRLGITWHGHEALVRRAHALRSRITAYDAVYVALAEGLRAPLLTCDARLAGAHGHTAEISLVE